MESTFSKDILSLIERKQSNLCISIDLGSCEDVLKVIECIGDKIIIAKLHIDTYEGFTPLFITKLIELKKKHDILLFEDRKFADIGHTTYKQLFGTFQIASWADLITIHGLPGYGLIDAVGKASASLKCLMLIQMSSDGNLFNADYSKSCLTLAKKYPNQVVGIISQQKFDALLTLTPGISLEQGSDALGQKYRTIEEAISTGTDIIIVGRAITKYYPDLSLLQQECEKFRSIGFSCWSKK